MFQVNCPDLAMFEKVRELSSEFGLAMDLVHGPKSEDVEGLRIVRVTGLPDRMQLFETMLPVRLHQGLLWKSQQVAHLEHMLRISP